MAISIDNVFFPRSLAAKATTVRKRLTYVRPSQTGYEPFRRAVQPDTIREWTIQTIPGHIVREENLQSDIRTVYHMWECAKAQLYNFYFRPPYGNTLISGEGEIISGSYYQVYTTRNPSNTIVRQQRRKVFPDTGVVVVGSTWTGPFYVAARFAMDEFEEEAEGEAMTLILPTVVIREVITE